MYLCVPLYFVRLDETHVEFYTSIEIAFSKLHGRILMQCSSNILHRISCKCLQWNIPGVHLHLTSSQLTVVHLVTHNADLQTTLRQQRVQWHSTAVTNIWFQRGGGWLTVLGMDGVL